MSSRSRFQLRLCLCLAWVVLSLWPTLDVQAKQSATAASDRPPSRETVGAIQTHLAERGYYSDQPDGLVGPMTRDAIRRYEQQAGLPETGNPTPALLRHLRAAPTPAPMAKQVEAPTAAAEADGPAPSGEADATVAGESWRVLDENGATLILTFRPEGLIDGTPFDDEWRWEQQGKTIRLHYANRLGRSATRTGTLTAADVMAGHAHSSRGSEWMWTAQRLR